MDEHPTPGAEPWHLLVVRLTRYGPALILHPSGHCPLPCIAEPGCVTQNAFIAQPVNADLGTHRARARFLPTGGLVLDIEPLPEGAQTL